MTDPNRLLAEANADVYPVLGACPRPRLPDGWNDAAWRRVPSLCIDKFRPESSAHRPRTRVKMVADKQRIYGLFQVEDRYIRSVHTEFQSPVYRDSCVEFFVQPRPDKGYFNFEFNCGGAFLATYILDPTRTPDGFRDYRPLTPAEGRLIRVRSCMPATVDPEMTEACTWDLAFQFPVHLLARYAGPLIIQEGEVWRANFYKCGDETSHPHWAAWQPVDELNFHLPDCFGRLRFGALGKDGERQDPLNPC
ncbi:MAG: carbohydrate-binding family 9-like protein [Desulfobacterales bacterium]|jgi:hypothetical protein